jgi:hypothetical protein
VVTDYEAAWVELMAHVASKTQHGRQDLLTKMAELAGEHRVAAGELSSVLRLYGVEVGRSRSASAESRFEEERIAAGFGSAAVADSPHIIEGTMPLHAAPEKTGEEQDREETPTPGVSPAQPLVADDEMSAAAEEHEARGEAAVEAYARDHEDIPEEAERDALDYLLGAKPPRLYGVPVEMETDRGSAPLTFVIRAQDGRKLDATEQRFVNASTGVIDRTSADIAIVGEATLYLTSPSGRKVDPRSEEFRTMQVRRVDTGEETTITHASPEEALEAQFRTQLGLLAGVAREVRRVSGFDPAKVGQAQRRLVEAAGN